METGFPSPAQGYEEQSIDLPRYLIPHPACTFLMRVGTDGLESSGLCKNDIVIIDRSIQPYHGALTVIETDSGFLCGVFLPEQVKTDNGHSDSARRPAQKTADSPPRAVVCVSNRTRIPVTDETPLFGVITRIIRSTI